MSNVIRNIRLGGITNIAEVSVPLEALTALVAPNNYGKSNVLQGVEFAVRFLTATSQERRGMMAQRRLIPINQSMDNRPFEFEISGTAAGYDYEYGYRFEWATTKEGLTGQRITGEWLRAKGLDEPKYRSLLKREGETEALMAPTPTSRCSKPLAVDGATLALDRLGALDKLFFAALVRELQAWR